MTDPRLLHIADYDYPLPEDRIAQFPLPQRDASKLLIYRGGHISEDSFSNLPAHLPTGALMVFNNTKVIRARLRFRKPHPDGSPGAPIEIFLLEPHLPLDYQQNFAHASPVEWTCMVGNLKRWKGGPLALPLCVQGKTFNLTAEHISTTGADGTHHVVRFTWPEGPSFAHILEAAGEIPIPPYLNRPTQDSDLVTYQTVYSKVKGSVAAPTAGLHFTPAVLRALDAAGVERQEVTLHVGAGTFKPVKATEIGGHEMHAEHIFVPRHVIERLIAHQAQAIAVGTTSVRTLETLYYIGLRLHANPHATEGELAVGQWEPYATPAPPLAPLDALRHILDWLDRNQRDTLHTATRIIIAPGYTFHIVRAIVTNFHQPQSTLLLLISAFVQGNWRSIYDYALTHQFRFLSYGDSSLLIP